MNTHTHTQMVIANIDKNDETVMSAYLNKKNPLILCNFQYTIQNKLMRLPF